MLQQNKTTIEQVIIDNARTWIGTPWRHNQQKKGVGVDCVRFLEAVARESGIVIPALPENYNRIAQNNAMKRYLIQHFERVPHSERRMADVLLFQPNGLNNHIGIATSATTVIHASQRDQKVVEHNLDGIWLKMLKNGGTWRLKKWD